MSPRPLLSLTRRTAERRAHSCALASTAHLDRVPDSRDDFWSDLRRGRRRLYGGLLLWIDRCHALGTPFDVIRCGVRVVWEYACDLFGEDPNSFYAPLPPTAALRAA